MSTYTRKYCTDGGGRFWPITHISAVRDSNGNDVETMLSSMTSYESSIGNSVDSLNSYTSQLGSQIDALNAAAGFSYVQITSNLTNVVCPVSLSNGQQHHVVYDNPGSTDYTIAISTSYSTPDGEAIELTVPGGGYAEINYLKLNNKVFVRAV